MRRFFVDPADITDNNAVLYGPEARHLRLVLRLAAGRIIELFDGRGNIYRAAIQEIGKNQITVQIREKKIFIEQGPKIHFGQALLKGQKMDFLVQKATELGIHAIHPFTSEHCVRQGHLTRNERWGKISLEACKQCGRPLPPDCCPVTDFKKIVEQAEGHDCKLIFWEKEMGNNLGRHVPRSKSIFFLIGPEGGFSPDEIRIAQDHGFHPVTLGPRVLRAETAAFCAMSVIQFLSGHLNHDVAEGRR